MLITFKAKVKLLSEEQMEVTNIDIDFQDAKWVWRKVAIPYSDIVRVIQYSRDKTLVYVYGSSIATEVLLVQEDYDSVFEKWNSMKLEHEGSKASTIPEITDTDVEDEDSTEEE